MEDKNLRLLKIAEDINKMIEYRAVGLSDKSNEVKYAFQELCDYIESEKDQAEELMQNYKDEGFTVNAIEAEGAYRTWTTIYNRMVDIRDQVKENNNENI